MNKDIIINEFNKLFDSPESTYTLKRIVLDLAFSGKLLSFPNTEISVESYFKLLSKGQRSSSKSAEGPFKIPNNWKWCFFGDYFDIQGGSQPPKSKFVYSEEPGYVQLFQIRDFGNNPAPVFVPKDLVTKFCDENDIMIGRYGASVGKIFFGKKGAYNVALVKLLYSKDLFSKEYLYYLFQTTYIQNFFSGMQRSAQAGFNKKDMSTLPLPITTYAEQCEIGRIITDIFSKINLLEQQFLARDRNLDELLESLTAA